MRDRAAQYGSGTAHARLAGIGWLALALALAGFFIWYVRRPVAK